MAKLGDVRIHVEVENYLERVDATGYAVEKGEPFTDHVEAKPDELTLTAHFLGSNHSANVSKIREYQRTGKLLRYVGRATASDVIILTVGRDYKSDVGNGVAVSISLMKVRVAKSPWLKVPPKQKPIQKPPTNGGTKKPVATKPRPTTARYHLTRKGDTYWDLSRKYGTSIPQLRTWNKYPDRQIPIGVKLRVK